MANKLSNFATKKLRFCYFQFCRKRQRRTEKKVILKDLEDGDCLIYNRKDFSPKLSGRVYSWLTVIGS